MEFAKWRAKNLSLRPVYFASALGNIVDEFVTTIVLSSNLSFISSYISFLALKSSLIDSMTKSASFNDLSISNSNFILSITSSTFLRHLLALNLSKSAIPSDQLLIFLLFFITFIASI